MTPGQLEEGYWQAYRDFYRWGSILRGAATKPSLLGAARHVAYAGGWKKMEPLWDWIIRSERVARLQPALETALTGFGRYRARAGAALGAVGRTLTKRGTAVSELDDGSRRAARLPPFPSRGSGAACAHLDTTVCGPRSARP